VAVLRRLAGARLLGGCFLGAALGAARTLFALGRLRARVVGVGRSFFRPVLVDIGDVDAAAAGGSAGVETTVGTTSGGAIGATSSVTGDDCEASADAGRAGS
jgi:hypothetical protein